MIKFMSQVIITITNKKTQDDKYGENEFRCENQNPWDDDNYGETTESEHWWC